MVALPEIAENYEKAEYIISIMDVYVKGLLSFCHLKCRLFSTENWTPHNRFPHSHVGGNHGTASQAVFG